MNNNTKLMLLPAAVIAAVVALFVVAINQDLGDFPPNLEHDMVSDVAEEVDQALVSTYEYVSSKVRNTTEMTVTVSSLQACFDLAFIPVRTDMADKASSTCMKGGQTVQIFHCSDQVTTSKGYLRNAEGAQCEALLTESDQTTPAPEPVSP